MRENVYNDGGVITPEMQATFLNKYAHLEGIINDGPFTYNYYSYPETGKGFKVTLTDGKAVQVDKMSVNDVKTIVSCNKLKFGE